MGYFRLPKRPAPRALVPVQQKLIEEGAIRVQKIPYGNGVELHKTIALRDPILHHFTEDELLVVDRVIQELWEQTATEVSDASHDVRWRTLNHRDPIPYEFAFLSDEPITQEEIERTRELANLFGW